MEPDDEAMYPEETDLPPVDPIAVDEVAALGFTFRYGSHNVNVYFHGEFCASSGHSRFFPGMALAYFYRGLDLCWNRIHQGWVEKRGE